LLGLHRSESQDSLYSERMGRIPRRNRANGRGSQSPLGVKMNRHRVWINRSTAVAFGFGVVVASVVVTVGSGQLAAFEAQAAGAGAGKWVVTGELQAPEGPRKYYRLEDTEAKVICYSEDTRINGALSCVKK
jgi:hypothetical protein